MVNKKPMTAMMGTGTERKTSSWRMIASPTMKATNPGSAAASLSETSMLMAVVPVTSTSTR